MGKSGKFAVIAGVVAAGLLVLTGMTLAEPVFVAFLGVLALAYLACIMEIVNRGRRLALLAAGAGTSLAVGFSLAFVSTWELAFAGESSFLGTPLPTEDPDNYFFGAAAAAVVTLLVLFLGAAWPRGRLRTTARVPAGAKRRPSTASRTAAKGAATQRTSGSRTPARVPVAAKRPPSSASPARTPPSKTGAKSTPRR